MNIKFNVLSIFCLLIVAVTASAQVVLLKGDYPDPSVLKDGDDYYRDSHEIGSKI